MEQKLRHLLSDLNLNLFQIFLYHFIQEFFQISIISDFLL